jgi:hypothetical protein
MDGEFFGSPDQQALLARGLALYDLLDGNPAMTYYGRGVGVVWGAPEATALLGRLATVQGVSNLSFVPDAEPGLRGDLEARGYAVTHYASWEGGTTPLAAAEGILADTCGGRMSRST